MNNSHGSQDSNTEADAWITRDELHLFGNELQALKIAVEIWRMQADSDTNPHIEMLTEVDQSIQKLAKLHLLVHARRQSNVESQRDSRS